MKYILILFLVTISFLGINAQNNDQFTFGKKGEASIRLIDTELIISKDRTNSILRFEINNNSPYPIYIPQPEIINGTVPQYFNLINESAECIFEDAEMLARSSSEFVLIPAKSSKQFELNEDFFRLSCLGYEEQVEATLVYRAFNFEHVDQFLTNVYLKNSRDSRDIIEYTLTASLKSAPIKIIYQ